MSDPDSHQPPRPSPQLEDREKETLERQIHTPEPQMSRLGLLYTCATTIDLISLVISSIAAVIGGALQPISFVGGSL